MVEDRDLLWQHGQAPCACSLEAEIKGKVPDPQRDH